MLANRGLRFLLIVSACVALLQVTKVGAVVIGDCSDKGADANLTYVDVANCGEKDEYCPFVRGSNASIEVAFKTNAPFKVAKVDIVGKIGIINKRFVVSPDDACGNYGFSCPVGPNEDKTLKLSLPVKSFYPKGLLVQVIFKLLDENQKNIYCITFPAKIVGQ